MLWPPLTMEGGGEQAGALPPTVMVLATLIGAPLVWGMLRMSPPAPGGPLVPVAPPPPLPPLPPGPAAPAAFPDSVPWISEFEFSRVTVKTAPPLPPGAPLPPSPPFPFT